MDNAGADPEFGTTIRQIRAYQAGDHSVADDLFRRYGPKVTKIVASRMGWPLREMADVEDVVQDAFIRAFKKLSDFEPRSESAFRHWLATIVRNRLASLDRKRKARGGDVPHLRDDTAFGVRDLPGSEATPSQNARANELQERREAALLALNDYQRELINLRENCGMTFPEIAETLKVTSADAVRVSYNRASNKLKESM